MDQYQKDYLAKKAQKMNPEWLKTGRFSEHLDKMNLLNKRILSVINKMPQTLRHVVIALAVANVGIWLKWIYDILKPLL